MEDGGIGGRLDESSCMVLIMDVGRGSKDEDIRLSSDGWSSSFDGEDGFMSLGADELPSLSSVPMRVGVVTVDEGDVVELQPDAGVDR